MMKRILVLGVSLLMLSSVAWAASSGGSSSSSDEGSSKQNEAQQMYDRGMELVKEGDFHGALKRFQGAYKKDKKNAEYLNMVAYTQRKTGNLEDAFETYEKVLGLKPNFPQAREYLGEAHLQALLLQIDVLRGYGDDGKEEYDLLVAALQEAAKTLTAGVEGPTPVPDKKSW